MIGVTVNDHVWAQKNINLLDRVELEAFVKSCIKEYVNSINDCDITIIELPYSATKSERYILHRMTIKGMFEPVSFTNERGRRMELQLSKKYVTELFKNDTFEQPGRSLPDISERQLIFNSLMKYIEDSWNPELMEYLNKW